MLNILQARLQQYMNHELPDVQAGFRKGRGTRDQIANIHWIMGKATVPVFSELDGSYQAIARLWCLEGGPRTGEHLGVRRLA